MHNIGKKPMKPLSQLKTVHYEHYAKLQSKHCSETVLLDDLKLFCKQHAAIDREYGQSLQKLVNSFLSRKELLCFRNAAQNENSDQQSIWRIWYSILNESNNIAISRLHASDNQQRLCNELKPLKSQRMVANKRVFEQLKVLQGDLAACVQDMVKSHKVYAEEEKQAQETRLKTMAAKEKIQRRSTDIFHSMAQLHRNYGKLLNKRQAFDVRSGTARNEYLFQLTAINAHLKHYFTNDLPYLVKTLDGELYEKLCDVFTTLCQTEIEICNVTFKRFENLLLDSSKINRICAWENFLKSSPLFDKTIQYQFEPMKGDEITLLCSTNMKDNHLEQIARKLARRLVLRERRIKSYESEMKILQAGFVSSRTNSQSQITTQPNSNNLNSEQNEELLAFNQEYVEHKVEELQFAIRREEIERVKVDACLNLLRNSSVDVKEFINEARLAAEAASVAAANKFREESATNLLNNLHNTANSSVDETNDSTVSSSTGIGRYLEQDRHINYWDRTVTDSFNTGYLNGFNYEYSTQTQQYTTGESNWKNNNWSSTFPRLTTSGQLSLPNDQDLIQIRNYTTNISSCSSTVSRQPHDYLNVDPSKRHRASDDIAIHHRTGGSDINKTTPSRVVSTINLADRDHSYHRTGSLNNDAADDQPEMDTDLEALWSEFGRLQRARVLYEFRAKRVDELDLVVHETVVLLSSNQSDGWVKVRSLIDGKEGLVPLNYLNLTGAPSEQCRDKDLNAARPAKCNQNTSPNASSLLINLNNSTQTNIAVDAKNFSHHTIKELDLISHSPPETEAPRIISYDKNCVSDVKFQNQSSPLCGSFCRCLIDFHGTNKDELTFIAGSIIRVLGRAPIINEAEDNSIPVINTESVISNLSVDDGWWEGELLVVVDNSASLTTSDHISSKEQSSGTKHFVHKRGVFPSMLVELLTGDESVHWTNFWKSTSPIKENVKFKCFVPQPNVEKSSNSHQVSTWKASSQKSPDKSDSQHSNATPIESIFNPQHNTQTTSTIRSMAGDYIQLKSNQENFPHNSRQSASNQSNADNFVKLGELPQNPVNILPQSTVHKHHHHHHHHHHHSQRKSESLKTDEELQIAEV